MSLASLYYLYGIYTPGGDLISQLTDTTPTANNEELVGFAGGHHRPLHRAVRGQKLDITFTSTAVGSILDLIAASGDIYTLPINGNLDLLYIQGTNQASRYAAAMSNHVRLRVTKGMLMWTSIRAPHQQEAEISCRLVPIYDGTNAPVVPAGGVALSGTATGAEWFTLGPVSINGVALSDEQEWTLDLNEQLREAGASGELWDTYVGIDSISPALTVRALGEPWNLLTLPGSALTALTFYLRKKATDGGNVANATAEHVKLSATRGLILPESARAGVNDPAETTLRIGLRAPNVSSNILTIDTTSAIT